MQSDPMVQVSRICATALLGVLCLHACDPKESPLFGLDAQVQDAKPIPPPPYDGGRDAIDATGDAALSDACIPRAERCDGVDDDCDGRVDEFVFMVGDSCASDARGLCGPGTIQCVTGVLSCVPDAEPSEEMCDGLDQDCDGIVDEGVPPGEECDSGLPGVCAIVHRFCRNGDYVCIPDTRGTDEVCNGLDDDCDGIEDEQNPGGGMQCDTGRPGRCGPGLMDCMAGELVCGTRAVSVEEICNLADDDCDGTVDEEDPGGGHPAPRTSTASAPRVSPTVAKES